MKRLILPCLALALTLAISACVPFNYNATAKIHRDKSNIKNGILIAGQPMRRFQTMWGPPTRTYSRRFNTGSKGSFVVGFGASGSFVANSRESYDLWFYKEKETTLVFCRQELVYWSYGAEPPTDADFKPKTID